MERLEHTTYHEVGSLVNVSSIPLKLQLGQAVEARLVWDDSCGVLGDFFGHCLVDTGATHAVGLLNSLALIAT